MKKFNFSMLILVLLQVFAPFQSVVSLNGDERGSSNCMNYTLTADKNEVLAGKEVQFTLEYESVTPACDAQQLANEEIDIDFSGLVDNESSISASYDTDIFNIDISPDGHVKITFKEWDDVHDSLEGFGGTIVFTIEVSRDASGDIVVTDNVGSDIIIHVNDGDEIINNTNKWSNSSYGAVGEVVDYSVRINTNEIDVTNFEGIDTPADGLKYVEDSFYTTDFHGNVIDPNIFTIEETEDNLIFKNTEAFNQTYVLHYQMVIVAQHEKYHNDFSATYDSISDDSQYTISYDVGGGGYVDFGNGKIEILKTNEAGNPLEGAEFDIYNAGGIVVDTLVTDADGYAISSQLALGEYSVVETKAPAGYILDSNPIAVSLSDNGEDNIVVGVDVVNQAMSGSVQVTKVDPNGNELSGAEFTIYNADGNEVEVITTDENGFATSSDLPVGDYTLVETKAPEGYVLNNKEYPFTIDSNQQVIEFEVINEKQQVPDIEIPEVEVIGQIDLSKTDEDGSVLSGAEFTIYDADGNEVEVITTDENGYAISSQLALGKYSVVETKAPDGYILEDTKYEVEIASRFDIAHVNDGNAIINEKQQMPDIEIPEVEVTGQIDLSKTDEDGNELSGAEFTIYDADGNEVEVITTDENGYAISSQLALGKYSVVETKAPDGYILEDTKYEVEIASRFDIAHVNDGVPIVNVKQKEEITVPDNESEVVVDENDDQQSIISEVLEKTGSAQMIISTLLIIFVAISLILKRRIA